MAPSTRTLSLLFAAVLVLAVWWGGTTRPPSTVALAAVSALLLLVAAWRARSSEEPLRLPPLAWPALAAAALAALQLVPLPPSVHARLVPESARVLGRVLAGVSEPGWRPITLDVAATLNQLARLLGVASLASAVAPLGTERREGLRLALALAVLALIVVPFLVILGVPLGLGAAQERARLRFSLVNPNHAASLLAAVLPVIVAQAARSIARQRLWWAALALAGNVALVGTASRGGVAVGVLGQLAVVVILLGRGVIDHRVWWAAGATATLAMVAVGAGLIKRLSLAQSTRGIIWRDALDLVRDHAFVGVGRGSFEIAFVRYSKQAGTLRHAFVENQYLQLACDYGVIGAIVVGVVLLVVGRRLISALRGRPGEAAAAVGALVLAAHNLVDFSWEGGAVAGVACVLVALALPSQGRRIGAPLVVALSLVTLLCAGLAASPLGRSSEGDLAPLRDASDVTAAQAAARAAFARHPGDAFVAVSAAARMLALGQTDAAFEWIERALTLAPQDVVAHRLAGHALLRAGFRAQAAGELRVALERGGDRQYTTVFHEIVKNFFNDEDAALLVAALPTARDRRTFLNLAVGNRRWVLVDALAKVLLEEGPDPVALRGLLHAARARKLDGSGLAEQLLAVSQTSDDAILAAQALSDAGRTPRALAILDAALVQAVEQRAKMELHLARAEVLERAGQTFQAAAERAEAARLSRY